MTHQNRLFFTNPIAALYMMKEFDVRLSDYDEEDLRRIIQSDNNRDYGLGVRDESESIFLPKGGDTVKSDEYVGIFGSSSPYEARSSIIIREEEPSEVVNNSEIEIIIRDGKHFLSAMEVKDE